MNSRTSKTAFQFAVYFVLLLIFSFQNTQVLAQFGSIRFERLSSADGLSHDHVYNCVRDQTGFMWFGTRSGLNRYDGYAFKIFRHDPYDSLSISDNEILSSVCTSNGELWFGTVNGLCKYNPANSSFVRGTWTNPLNQKANVTCFTEGSDQILWIGSSKGLHFVRPGNNHIYPASDLSPEITTLDSISVTDLFVYKEDLYVTTEKKGLLVLNLADHSIRSFDAHPESKIKLYANQVKHVLFDSIGNMWLGYRDCTVERINFDTGEQVTFDELRNYTRGDMRNSIAELIMDHDGRIWCSTSLNCLSYFDNEKQHFLNLKDIPYITAFDNTRSARSIYIDSEGTFWLAMHTSGVLFFTLNPIFTCYERPDGLPDNASENALLGNWVRACAEDPQKNLWIGTVDGVSILNRKEGTFTALANKSESDSLLANNSIRSMINVENRYMMIGTAEGLTKIDFNTGKSKIYRRDPENPRSISGNFVLDFALGKNSELYIATSYGFCRYNETTDDFYSWDDDPELDSLFSTSCRSLLLDKNDVLWIGTARSGLLEFHPENQTVVNHNEIATNPLLSGNAILDLMDDGENLWIGTIHGFVSFNKKTGDFSHFDFGFKPPPAMFSNLVFYKDSTFWLTCTEGLVHLNPADSSMRLFNVHNGLSTNSFHFQNAFLTYDGFICLPSLKGLVMFQPEATENMDLFPVPKITGIRILNTEVDLKNIEGRLELEADQNFFTISLNTFDYLRKENVKYAYMLKGLHNEWIMNGTNRDLSFTAIPGGDYELLYKSTTTEGYWPEEYGSLYIHVDTVYYKQWWFGLSVIATTGVLLFFILNYRKKLLKKEEVLRQKIAGDLHDDIGATLSSIRMYSEIALTRGENNEVLLKRISENARDMVESMSDMVWTIKPGKEKFSDLHNRLFNFAQEMCGPAEIELHFRIDESLLELKLSMEQRKDIYLVFKEAINNAVKYSACRNLTVTLRRAGSALHFAIEDDGSGFDPESVKKGNGLENMRARVDNLRGKVSIKSSPDGGTHIHFEIPLTHIG